MSGQMFWGKKEDGKRKRSFQESYETPKVQKCVRKRRPALNVQGQPLPPQRSLEMMSKDQLMSVLMEVMRQHPEVGSTFQAKVSSYQFASEKYQQLLKGKVEQLYSNIPYNRSYDNTNLDDYAFVRMKPYITELLNCLVDCALDNLPPRKSDLHESLKFLESCTQLVLDLPRFESGSNNYYYDKCLEQISHLWCSLIEQISKDIHMVMNTNMEEWITKLNAYNERSNGLLTSAVTLFKSLASDGDLLGDQQNEMESPAYVAGPGILLESNPSYLMHNKYSM